MNATEQGLDFSENKHRWEPIVSAISKNKLHTYCVWGTSNPYGSRVVTIDFAFWHTLQHFWRVDLAFLHTLQHFWRVDLAFLVAWASEFKDET